ncbi:MAG: bacteriohemerythrin [Desulfopila sp.]
MIWSENYKIGIPAVDAQHKRLFAIIGELQAALQAGLRSSDFEQILQTLDQYKTRHFQLEEKYMKESGYPGLAEQQRAHQYFTKRFEELGEELAQTGMTSAVVQTVQKELTAWLKEHVTGLDTQFGKYYQKQGRT